VKRTSIRAAVALMTGSSLMLLAPVQPAQGQVGLERRIVHRQDIAVPGYEVLLVEVTLAVGGREGKHSHPGELIGRIFEGELTLEQEGLPTRVLRPGESVVVDAGRVHEGINNGKVPVKAFATFVVPKGKPLTTQLGETAPTP